MAKQTRRKISLALQGGGAHGAYTWGVLDRLAEGRGSRHYGHVRHVGRGDECRRLGPMAWPNMAPQAQRRNWKRCGAVSRNQARTWRPMARSSTMAFAYASALQSLASPYDLNPFNLNPLRRSVESVIDFDAGA